jgi:hypothetical protein
MRGGFQRDRRKIEAQGRQAPAVALRRFQNESQAELDSNVSESRIPHKENHCAWWFSPEILALLR